MQPRRELLDQALYNAREALERRLSESTAQRKLLQALGDLIVGSWEAADSRHVIEWGVGRKLIRARSYFPSEDGWRLSGKRGA